MLFALQLSATAIACFLISVALWLSNPLRHLPGPWYTVFTGAVLTRHTLRGQRIHYVHKMHKMYGSVVRIAPDEVDVSDAEGFQRIHKVGSGFLKSPWYSRFRPGGVNVFNAIDARVHAQRRKALARPFSKTSLRQNWEAFVAEKSRLTVAKIKQDAQGGRADLYKWWTLMTTDVIGKLSFGEDFGMLNSGTKNQFVLDLESVSKMRGIRAQTGRMYPIFKAWKDGFSGRFEEAELRLTDYSKTVVVNAHSYNMEKSNIFTDILRPDRKQEDHISNNDAVMEAGALVVAGSGTTAVTLTYLIWAVLSHPQVQKRLEEEVATLDVGFTDANLETLPYLNAVIEESLRLYGSAPGSLPRTVPESGLQVQGYYIPPGYTVETQAYTIHRDPRMFDNASRFHPERWLKSENEKALTCAFGAGSRVCLGLHLAYMEMRHAVAGFFRECAGAKLAASATEDCMFMEHYFLIVPKGRRCEVTLS